MPISDYLTPEDLQIMLDETYGNQQTQDFIRPNPLQFQYPYIPGGIMNTGSVMYDEFPPGFSFRPQGLDTSRFKGMDLESGYLDRAGSSDQDIYAEQEKQKGGGIGGLFRFLLGLAVPGSGLFMGDTSALQGIKNLNQRLRNTDFGQSRTLQEYLQRREARKDAERLQTVGQQLQQASERGGGYQPTSREQNVARTESRRADKGLGQGGVYGL